MAYGELTLMWYSFFEHYHHFLEILDASLSPDQYYDRSALLFWSIISVAARRYEEDAALLGSLRRCVTKLLWCTISVLPHSRPTIQAILLISVWPFPTSSMSTSISFILVSLARTASMQLGLHRPEAVQDFMRSKTPFDQQGFQEAVRIWGGCYIAVQR
jgi:transcriptional regulatory protein LEU3